MNVRPTAFWFIRCFDDASCCIHVLIHTFQTNKSLLWVLRQPIHPDRVEHVHASLVVLDPCQEGDLLRRLQQIHVPVHHFLHCLHVVVDTRLQLVQ